MRLKKLVLQGYKTFASKTEFVFDEGITAIVGPNGSGKSNIADAVRWVLGEQSYSTLRGKKTIDMIFAGSQSRPRAGMAQAILTLDNSDGWLPIDYSEVEIGRRAHRSGENEYILNGQKVRLKDITDLLATSGLAERTYTIIGQGLVDQALSLRADERRALFEEAAGINHYKTRRAETLRRLQETQRNLQRVHDILAEIRPRLNSLRRQATRAQNYEQISQDLQNLLRIWYGYRWEVAKKEIRRARETAVSSEKTWQTSRQRMRVQQENADDLRRQIHRLQQKVSDTQNERDDLRDQLENARRQVAIMQERRESVQRRLAEVEAELPPISQQREAAASELAAATEELTAAQASLTQAREQLQMFNANFQTQQATINKWQSELQNATQAQRSTQNRVAQLQGQLNQLREQLQEQTANQPSGDEGELVKMQAAVEKLTAVFTTAQQKVEEQRQQRNDLQKQRQELIQELKNLRRDLRNQEQQLSRQQKELARLEAQTEMLNQMRRQETAVPDNINILGNLATVLSIPAQHQQAIEAALQTRLGTLLLPDEVALWQLLSERDPETALAVAVADSLQPAAPPEINESGTIGWAESVVSFDKQFAPLVQLLLGRVLLVDDVKSGVSIAKSLPAGCVAVAPDGTVAHAGGLIELVGQSTQDSLLAREEAWREAQQKLESKKDEVAALETAVAEQQTVIQTKQEAVDERNSEEQRLGRLLNEASQRVSQAQRDADRQKQQQTFIERQQKAQAEATARLQTRIETLASHTENDEAELVRLESSVSQAQAQLDSLPVAEAQQQRETLRQNIGAEQTIVDGRRAVVDSRRATLNQFEQQLTRLKQRQASLQQQQAELAQNKHEQDRLQLQDQMSELDAQLAPMKGRLVELQDELGDVEESTAVSQKEAHDHETIYTQAKIAYSQQKSEIEGLQERIKADLGIVALHYDDDQTGPTPLPISGVQALPKITELPDDIEETIQTYRGQMQRMGAINPDAPEEYQETQDRFDFMTQQIEDLNETEEKLRKVIEELDELTSRAFAETVDKVNAVFGETFTQLFGGGAGRLVLTDPDDLTVSGVDIVARLPNRREQGLGLLSGGERSLTAAALIFSLLKVSPTPFCVMDEVDAALDEANINRFREQLRELALGTQFIVITHNRGTVQAAQTIYGISMGSDSASQAISIKPEEYIKQPELL
ncbi:chromosome segregation protein SMC [Candidatus Leptofilum sp.]|uniref:chromosome segregation protein SMC n=1 Tax=Candidatus Leptofilum sp. TaxID=3241576 RepID=UPI003B590FAF